MMIEFLSFFDTLSTPTLGQSHFWSQASALFQVVLIDIVMAGDNAVAVGLAAAGLAPAQRKKAIMWGLIGAIVTRIIFVLLTVELMKIIGLLFAGGILLMWVAWKMWRELREQSAQHQAENALEHATGVDIDHDGATSQSIVTAKPKSMRAAITQILIADVSMSLDNVLAVAGAAHKHPLILVFGLILAIILMGAAAHVIANVLHKYRWIGYIGLVIILFVAVRMMWEGGHQILEHKEVWAPFVKQTLGVSL